LPPPESFALYNQHIPNGADRIMAMAEKQSEHRRAMEETIIRSQTEQIRSQTAQSGRGQFFALVIGLVAITAGTVLTLMGHDTVGGVIAVATVIALVFAFITGQRPQQASDEK
jgi:uncharacterized membrane protein